jgi:hypothetical protein
MFLFIPDALQIEDEEAEVVDVALHSYDGFAPIVALGT